MGIYSIRFKPIDKFYFGSNKCFGNDNKRYILHSNYFPQQTTILGALRKEILVQEKIINVREKYNCYEAKIGNNSFRADEKEQSFGLLESISPVVISSKKDGKKQYYLPTPFNHNQEEKSKYKPYTIDKNKKIVASNKGTLYTFEDYKGKKGIYEGLVNCESLEIIDYDKIFCSKEQIGIHCNSENKGYFKQTKYTFKEDYEFEVFVNVDYEFRDSIVQLGDAESLFTMKVDKIERDISCEEVFNETIQNIINHNHNNKMIVFTSDTYVEKIKEIEEVSDFSIINTIPFKFQRTSTGNYAYQESKIQYTLIKRGSIIYTDYKSQLIDKINSYQNFKKIGYNYTLGGR